MLRVILATLFAAAALLAANFKLYLKDGNYHVVREYKIEEDRVRFYALERSDWEEIPLALVDVKRTEEERAAHDDKLRQDLAQAEEEEKYERERRKELESIPQEQGVYLVDSGQVKTVKPADSKQVNDKKRSVLKVLSPVPLIAGRTTVEIDGERSSTVIPHDRPEFYVRFDNEAHVVIARVARKKGGRIVQRWTLVPVSKELVEEQDEVEVFRKQVDEGLYKIWPTAPLAPGEYAVLLFTPGKGDTRIWDFAVAKP